MKKYLWMLAVAGSLALPEARATVIAEFDKGSKPNNVNGDFGAWDKDPADPTQYAREAFDKVNTRTGSGFAMRITYDVDSPNAAYNGFWMKLGNFDATKATKLVFWAKGDEKKGCTSRVKVEIKTASERGSFYVDGISSQWTKFEVPLSEFMLTDVSTLTELVYVFEDHSTLPKEGILYIDDISIE
ncbi:MAG: hypothetical protein H3C50_00615 [Kiritimatiellae bacterium]|nr:hypothetical protein [Kiritimatiellia bacterium]MCO5045045.1 hypothetical protein [Kiritimatiellia bacterium]MCO5062426.1 hypothetical protein [Kiritimatiellia bacterium]MCO5068672.1 hypothetical protein [Kiritimatiellia bacterium]